MRKGIATKSVWPDLAVHADPGLVATCVAEFFIQLEGTGFWVKIHHEQPMLTVFARVQDDAASIRVGGNPVWCLLFVECDA